MNPLPDDTICAVSTPLGMGGIGIVRVSGSGAVGILSSIFSPKDRVVAGNYKSHRIYYGHVVKSGTSMVIDEALVSVMRAPRTFTREDVVEINCHGGPSAVRKVLEAVVSAGARLAEPGEFTRRAFLNGRIDLTQAEAVMDVISAASESSLAAAVDQLRGGIGERSEAIRAAVAEMLALVEVSIDFPEDEIDYVPLDGLFDRSVAARADIAALLSTYSDGRLLREGLRLAIVGSPNVGKSSLLNRLCRAERAIVTDTPGTTRDTVEEHVVLGGLPVKLIDTAGIREGADEVEREGIRRSVEAIGLADLTLFVVDGSRQLTAEDAVILKKVKDIKHLIVINKSDIGAVDNLDDITRGLGGEDAVRVSAKTGDGLDGLVARIKSEVLSGGAERPPTAAINLRHKLALEKALEALLRFEDGCRAGLSQEFLAVELRDALDAIGRITGKTTTDDILNKIFNDFCIGK